MRIIKQITSLKNGVEVIKSKYLVAKDVDLHVMDSLKEAVLYEELSQLLNL